MELRRLGSEYHWAVTGSSEVASGYRATYAMNGTTQPTQKEMVQAGENIIVDLHPLYQLYPSDRLPILFWESLLPSKCRRLSQDGGNDRPQFQGWK